MKKYFVILSWLISLRTRTEKVGRRINKTKKRRKRKSEQGGVRREREKEERGMKKE